MAEQAPTCTCGEKHLGHICVLKSKGMNKEVEHLTKEPTVVCFNCGVEANSPDNVCAPMPLD